MSTSKCVKNSYATSAIYSNYKDKQFYQIDTYVPSSQTCSVCGKIDKKYKNLEERNYLCTNCHNELDRDVNDIVNIMFE